MAIKNNPYFFLAFPIIAILGGLIGYDQYNIFNATLIFDVWFVFFLLNNFHLRKTNLIISFALITYISISFIVAKPIASNNLTSFIVIYKSIFYLSLLFFLRKKSKTQEDFKIDFLFNVVLYAFLIKYIVFFLSEIDTTVIPRPGLFTENNFELAFLICLVILKYKLIGSLAKKDYLILIVIFILSFSKSGILSLIVTLLILNMKMTKKGVAGIFLSALIIMALVNIVTERHTSLETVDRFNFLMIFIEEVKNLPLINIIFGASPITPLSDYACHNILFSDSLLEKDGNCYSTTFHSYWLRTLFDHGIVGLVIVLLLLYKLINSEQRRIKWAILGLVLANGLSVSSINSVYLIFGIALIMTVKESKLKHQHPQGLIQ